MIKGRSALITGSVQGIGLATANALAAQGCDIMLGGFGERAAIERTRAALEADHGVRVRYHGADLSRREEIDQMVAATIDAFGSFDILVNNAVVRTIAAIEDFPADRWQMALAVNLTAPFHLVQRALPGMRERGWGRIVNVSSGFGLIGIRERIDYVTTKTALIGMARAIAVETAGSGITCNAVCPGATLTPRQVQKIDATMARDGVGRDEAMRGVMADMAVDRFVPADSVGAVIAFLCSDAAGDISGAALPVDAGFTAGAMLRTLEWKNSGGT